MFGVNFYNQSRNLPIGYVEPKWLMDIIALAREMSSLVASNRWQIAEKRDNIYLNYEFPHGYFFIV